MKELKEEGNREKSIRFITGDDTELFRVEDGGTILVTFPDRQSIEKCGYVDDRHVKIGNSVYHIRQYAQMLECGGGRCEPEPETALSRAAWQIGRGKYLKLERTENGFRYEILTTEFLPGTQGWLDGSFRTMNRAREHVLETMGLCRYSRVTVSFEMLEKKAGEVLRSSDVGRIELKDSKYYPGMRTAEHTLSCEIRGEPALLTYEVSRHDDGEAFVIHSNGKDIWDIMPEAELRKLDSVLAGAVEYGHWKRELDGAETPEAVREVRYGLCESENLIISKEQIGKLFEAIDRKETALTSAEKTHAFGSKRKEKALPGKEAFLKVEKDYPKPGKAKRR